MRDFLSFKEIAKQTIEERRKRSVHTNFKYWIEILDDYCWWIIENELVVIWAWSWVGKTELAIHIAITNALLWKKVALFSLEWDKWEIIYRYFQKEINLKLQKEWRFIKWPEYRLNIIDIEKYEDQVFNEIPKELEENIKIFNKTYIPNRDKLLNIIRDNYTKFDMFVIDHLHYLDYWEDERIWLSKIINSVKEATEIIKKPVVMVSHLNRNYIFQKRFPTKNDLHWSSDIEKNANTVILLIPDEKSQNSELSQTRKDAKFLRDTLVIVDKNRTWMPVPAMFTSTFDLRTKTYLPWEEYNILSFDEQNRVSKFDKIINK